MRRSATARRRRSRGGRYWPTQKAFELAGSSGSEVAATDQRPVEDPLLQLIRRAKPAEEWWDTVCPQTGSTFRNMLRHWEEARCWGCMMPLQEALQQL